MKDLNLLEYDGWVHVTLYGGVSYLVFKNVASIQQHETIQFSSSGRLYRAGRLCSAEDIIELRLTTPEDFEEYITEFPKLVNVAPQLSAELIRHREYCGSYA